MASIYRFPARPTRPPPDLDQQLRHEIASLKELFITLIDVMAELSKRERSLEVLLYELDARLVDTEAGK
jgi:hypothetical protein